jgi:aryl-alcohol dehydrogenase-like predicted oxidoreductase
MRYTAFPQPKVAHTLPQGAPQGPQLSVVGLGTMTWGKQNSEADAHQQLDYALDHGVNVIDAAEIYPVPMESATQGLTERYIGSWLASRGCRDRVFLATKVAGRSERINWLRSGQAHQLDRANIRYACQQSLQRLRTDVIDLYQLHWPDRNANCFGQRGYTSQPDLSDADYLAEALHTLHELQQEGLIRHSGLSNETPWGTMTALHLAKTNGWAPPITVQNPYSLLNRQVEVGLAEVLHREGVGLLPYSPLAFGLLSGKYHGQAVPPQSRLALFPHYFDRYNSPQAREATAAYIALAQQVGLSPTTLALAFVNTRPFNSSNLIGATTMAQLAENIASADVVLSPDVLRELDAIHARYPDPCP